MLWRLTLDMVEGDEAGHVDGRYVIHRHRDAQGVHLDLRLEQDACLTGWRIDGSRIEPEAWAVEKGSHPTRWLDQDGEMVRVDAGTYTWLTHEDGHKRLVLRGKRGEHIIDATLQEGLPARVRGQVCRMLDELKADAGEAPRLIEDGVKARRRLVQRLCGLGRELDGDGFDEGAWRKALANLSLDEVQRHLHAFELRFDRKYPPHPTSRPEQLPDDEPVTSRAKGAMAIIRGDGRRHD